jgi:hypothetical protein
MEQKEQDAVDISTRALHQQITDKKNEAAQTITTLVLLALSTLAQPEDDEPYCANQVYSASLNNLYALRLPFFSISAMTPAPALATKRSTP